VAQEDVAVEPLILTLQMDELAQEWFDRLRELHFPPERNYLGAHLTLFHKLPGEREAEISTDLREICRNRRPLTLTVTGLRSLGRGVAYELSSTELVALRRDLAKRWEPWLGAQDRQGFRPHVTVQNKVAPETAQALREQLLANFSPFEVGGEGLSLSRYLGGPWEPVGAYPFGGRPVDGS
jgi:2'-5' RNA ligase